MTTPLPDEYVMVMKKRQPKPIWLKEHQDRFREAMRIAGEETKHLKGPERVRAMNQLARKMLKRAQA